MTDNSFFSNVDSMVLGAINSNPSSFNEILTMLPGIYPSQVKDSIIRLGKSEFLPSSVISISPNLSSTKTIQSSTKTIQSLSYIPHPLDYDWRFHDSTKKLLIENFNLLSTKNDTIILLGTPSILETKHNFKNRVLLLDKNPPIFNSHPNLSVIRCDILTDSMPKIKANVILADPPWYPEHIKGFLCAAYEMSKTGSYLMLCLPPEGTRATMHDEIADIVDYAKSLGFDLLRHTKSALSYNSPLFEKNALDAEGFAHISSNWRRGDLALFYRKKESHAQPKPNYFKSNWEEIQIKSVRIRVRISQDIKFQDPSLKSLVPNDILPSVSRRDERRNLVDVWTSGNRIFSCNGTNTLTQILKALQQNQNPISHTSKFFNRDLTPDEMSQINTTAKKLNELLECEQKEIELYYSKRYTS